MKKLIYSVLALAAMALTFPSCNDDAPEEVQMTFMASLAQNASSRALSDGGQINRVKCEVYEEVDGEKVKRTEEIVTFSDGSAEYTPTLLKGRTYTAVFFAYTEESYDVSNLQSVTRKKDNCNDEMMDAFSGVISNVNTEVTGTALTVTLTRPLSQLNFATTADDIKNARKLLSTNGLKDEEPAMTLYTSSIKIAFMSSSYNVLEGKSNDETVERVLSEASIPTEAEKIEVNGTEYTVLATTYLFPGETTTCYLNVYAASEEDNSDKILVNKRDWTLTYSNVPLLANTRTNVIGSLMTGNVPYEITLNTGFTGTEQNSGSDGNFPNPNEQENENSN